MRKPLTKFFLLFFLFLLFMGFAGGPLGAAFLGLEKPVGILGGPLPHIDISAEEVISVKETHLKILSFYLTNTMITAVVVSLFLITISWIVSRRLFLVPRGFQNLLEAVVEYFFNLVDRVAGKEFSRPIFLLVATIFLFILMANWMGLFPFIGSIGLIEKGYEEHFKQISLGGFKVFYVPFGVKEAVLEGYIPLVRPATTDVNIPLALAIIGMGMVQYWGMKASGALNYISRFIALRNLLRGKPVTGVVDLAVGGLEAVGQGAQVISLTFRLFGNLFAGDVLILIMSFLLPLAWVVAIYGLEIIIGLVQAFIFAMLILTFSALAVAKH